MEQRHVLVADDEPHIGRIIKMKLEQGPFRVTLAYDGQEAIDLLESQSDIDLVLLDLMMPNLSGLDVLAVYLEARRAVLEDRFIAFWQRQEETGTWLRLEHAIDGYLHRAREARRTARAAERARAQAEAAERAARQAEAQAEQARLDRERAAAGRSPPLHAPDTNR